MKQVIIRYRTSPEMEKYVISSTDDCRISGNMLLLELVDGMILGINTDRISDFTVEDHHE